VFTANHARNYFALRKNVRWHALPAKHKRNENPISATALMTTFTKPAKAVISSDRVKIDGIGISCQCHCLLPEVSVNANTRVYITKIGPFIRVHRATALMKCVPTLLNPHHPAHTPNPHYFRPTPVTVSLKTTRNSCNNNVLHRWWHFVQWFISKPTEALKSTAK